MYTRKTTYRGTASDRPAEDTVAVPKGADLLWPNLGGIDKGNHQDRLSEEEGIDEDHGSGSGPKVSIVGAKLA